MSDLSVDGLRLTPVTRLSEFQPKSIIGASRYRHTLLGGEHVDALLANAGSDVLVVTFHGALDRRRFTIPRFERVRTTLQHDVSGLFLADPALWKAPHLELAWYTGWPGFEMHRVAAAWAWRAARAVGARHVLFTGSSGGGFAALQAARFLPGSAVLAFNPQTSIHRYTVEGSFGAQRTYVEALWPHIAPEGVWSMDWRADWTEGLGDALSVLRTYSRPVDVHVLYVDNPNDAHHHEEHYLPFRQAAEEGGNLQRVRTHTYDGRPGHHPPTPEEFHAAMAECLRWVRQLPAVDETARPDL